MKRIVTSALVWTGALVLIFGVYRLFFLLNFGVGRNGIWFDVLLLAIAVLMIYIGNRLGWDNLADLIIVGRLFQRIAAAARKHMPPVVQDTLLSKQRTFRLVRPPRRLQRYLLTISLMCLLMVIVLQFIEPAHGMPTLDIVKYVFLSLAALAYLIRILLSGYFFLRNVIFSLRGNDKRSSE
jgi:hypothetical protein